MAVNFNYLVVDEVHSRVGLTGEPKEGVAINFIKIWRGANMSEEASTKRYIVYEGTSLAAKFAFESTSIIYDTVPSH